jgi:tetratricopeptide (TPR) repeat protein
MKSYPLIKMILLCSTIVLTSCTYATKLGDKLFPDSEFNTLVVKADAAMQDEQWAKAAELYKKAGHLKPDDMALKLKEAKAYQNDGKFLQAFNTYQVIIDAKLPASEANKRIEQAAKDNQIKFGFKITPSDVKADQVKKSLNQEVLQKDEVIEEKVIEEPPAISEHSLSLEEVMATPEQVKAFAEDTNKSVLEALNAWAGAWETKNLTKYFAHYVDDFAGDLPNAKAWRQSRKIKILHSPHIKVSLSEIQVLRHQGTVEVTFKQNYESATYQDIGHKTLVMKYLKGRWLIKKELFN